MTKNAITAVAANVNEEPNDDQIIPAIMLANKLQML